MFIKEADNNHKLNIFVSGTIFLDERYYLKKYGPSVKEFLGSNNALCFNELGFSESDNEEIEEFLEDIQKEGHSRLIVNLSDRDNRPRLVDMHGRLEKGSSTPIEVDIWELNALEDDYLYYMRCAWKYRTMISLTELTFFDYNIAKNNISFYRYTTRKSTRLFYGTIEEFQEEFLNSIIPSETNLASAHKIIDQLLRQQNTVEGSVESSFLSKSGQISRIHFRARIDDSGDTPFMYGVVSNISGTDDLPFYMTNAGLDSMTGLLNKRSIAEFSEDLFTNPATAMRKHYMILVDIDDFKSINDNYGHQMGDKAIMLVSRVLAEVIKEAGVVGRYGGDEFFILTDYEMDEETLRTRLRMISNTVSMRGKEELGIGEITLSIGVAEYPAQGKTFKDLLTIADKCLYIAKEKGKNRYIIYRPNLHGEVQVENVKKSVSSYDEQAKVVNKVIREMFVNGKAVFQTNLNEIVKGFDLDNIDAFYGPGLEKRFSVGKYDSGLDCKLFLNNERYRSYFDTNGLAIVNNYNNLKKINPEIFEYLDEKRCMSVIQLVLPSIDKPELFISFNMLNRTHKWSDAEISNLGLLGTLAYEIYRREIMVD